MTSATTFINVFIPITWCAVWISQCDIHSNEHQFNIDIISLAVVDSEFTAIYLSIRSIIVHGMETIYRIIEIFRPFFCTTFVDMSRSCRYFLINCSVTYSNPRLLWWINDFHESYYTHVINNSMAWSAYSPDLTDILFFHFLLRTILFMILTKTLPFNFAPMHD